jgi:hypothetical protein
MEVQFVENIIRLTGQEESRSFFVTVAAKR